MKKAIIIGGGFAGCTWAYLLGRKGFEVTLLEKGHYLGGGCKTFFYAGHPYTIGPRHLLVRSEEAIDLITRFVPIRRYEHGAMSFIERDGQFYNYFPGRSDINKMPDKDTIWAEIAQSDPNLKPKNVREHLINTVGPTIYSKFCEKYNQKMWGVENVEEIDSEEMLSLLKNFLMDNKNYLSLEAAYPIPANGYDDYFTHTTVDAKVLLRTQAEAYDLDKPAVLVNGQWMRADLLVSTIPVDELMQYSRGRLRFVGKSHQQVLLPVEQVIPGLNYFAYYPGNEDFLRMIEFKKFTLHKSPYSLIGLERFSDLTRDYPFPGRKEQALAADYINDLPDHVISEGRAGIFRYIDVCQTIMRALDGIKNI